ncbi:hypothetical protein NFI96_005260 [Prochilodus magdalenae]|nr:hypothetical protein NFI96_005260 [Prochilodus magdalenae]
MVRTKGGRRRIFAPSFLILSVPFPPSSSLPPFPPANEKTQPATAIVPPRRWPLRGRQSCYLVRPSPHAVGHDRGIFYGGRPCVPRMRFDYGGQRTESTPARGKAAKELQPVNHAAAVAAAGGRGRGGLASVHAAAPGPATPLALRTGRPAWGPSIRPRLGRPTAIPVPNGFPKPDEPPELNRQSPNTRAQRD